MNQVQAWCRDRPIRLATWSSTSLSRQQWCLPVSDVPTSHHLRSSSRRLLVIPRYRLSTYGRPAFSVTLQVKSSHEVLCKSTSKWFYCQVKSYSNPIDSQVFLLPTTDRLTAIKHLVNRNTLASLLKNLRIDCGPTFSVPRPPLCLTVDGHCVRYRLRDVWVLRERKQLVPDIISDCCNLEEDMYKLREMSQTTSLLVTVLCLISPACEAELRDASGKIIVFIFFFFRIL